MKKHNKNIHLIINRDQSWLKKWICCMNFCLCCWQHMNNFFYNLLTRATNFGEEGKLETSAILFNGTNMTPSRIRNITQKADGNVYTKVKKLQILVKYLEKIKCQKYTMTSWKSWYNGPITWWRTTSDKQNWQSGPMMLWEWNKWIHFIYIYSFEKFKH